MRTAGGGSSQAELYDPETGNPRYSGDLHRADLAWATIPRPRGCRYQKSKIS
jgi:hypothetical protein